MAVIKWEGDISGVKPYLLYVGDHYYPGKGNEDLRYSADTVEELQALLPDAHEEFVLCGIGWYMILQTSTMHTIDKGSDNV